MTREEIHNTLVKALNDIHKYGWIKGSFGWHPKAPACLVGRINYALESLFPPHIATEKTNKVLNALGLNGSVPAQLFNDHYLTGMQDIIHMLERGIANTAPDPEQLELEEEEKVQPELVHA